MEEHVGDASPRGTYVTIAGALRAELEASPPTTVLPSESELQARYGVARTTVRRALKMLAEDHLIEARRGVGWQVRATVDETPVTLHEQIERSIADAVQRGKLREGDAVPSEAQLTREFGVSRGKVRQALAHLEGAGLLVTVPGKPRRLAAGAVRKSTIVGISRNEDSHGPAVSS